MWIKFTKNSRAECLGNWGIIQKSRIWITVNYCWNVREPKNTRVD